MNSVLLPVLLYPVLLWVEITALTFVTGLSERTPARIALVDPPPAHEALLDTMSGRGAALEHARGLSPALERLDAGDLDAVVRFTPSLGEEALLADNFRAEIHYDRALERSRRARDRVDDAVSAYRDAWLGRETEALGIQPGSLEPFDVEMRNVSTGEDVGAALLSLMIPMFLVIAVALGCLVPAIDTTAGERERGTWETLLSTGASRGSIVTAKYLYVASFGAMAGVLNATAMTVVLGPVMAPLQSLQGGGPALAVSLSATTWLMMVLGAAALALFFAAAMMLLAGFAHTFKDGQAMVTPVFYLALIPLVLGQQSDRTLTPALAAIPVANVAMMIRDAIRGVFLWPMIAETLLVSGALVALCLRLARSTLGYEDFLLGAHRGGFWSFARDRMRRGRGAAPAGTEAG